MAEFTPLIPDDLDSSLYEALRNKLVEITEDEELAGTLAFPLVDVAWECVATHPWGRGRYPLYPRILRVIHDPEVGR